MIGFLDLPSGLSGDMFLGCLVDCGWAVDELRHVIDTLNLPAGSIEVSSESVMRGPLRATFVHVKTAETSHHRHLDDVRGIIQSADLPPAVKDRAIAVFTRLAHAEAKVHGTAPDRVHFHEVGALDAIADIVGVCAGVDAIHIGALHASALPVGPGWANTLHGPIPLPAPATLEILAAVGAPVRPAPTEKPAGTSVQVAEPLHVHRHPNGGPAAPQPPRKQPPRELVTPTAAALLAELATFEQPAMRLRRIGLGAGSFQFTWPNVARLWLGDEEPASPLVQIETNIDDMNPQFFPAVSDRLFAAGAVDVWLTPIQMKKGRPAILLSVLAPAVHEQALADILLQETTTLGVRVHHVHRHEAAREFRTVQTTYGQLRLKLKTRNGQVVGFTPEYEDCRKLAEQHHLPLKTIHEAALAAGMAITIGRSASSP